MGAAEVISELQSMDFNVKAGLFSASETGAPHQRRRLFIMAHANHLSLLQQGSTATVRDRDEVQEQPNAGGQSVRPRSGCAKMDADVSLGQINGSKAVGRFQLPIYPPAPYQFGAWSKVLARRPDLQPEFFGLDNGVASRVERSRAAGNGVASLAAAYAWRTLKAAHIAEISS